MRPRLRSFELSWTDATFEAICSDSRPRTLDPNEARRAAERVHPARFFDELLGEVPFEQFVGLRVALWVVALSPLFTIAKFATIASLSPRDRERAVGKLLSSSVYVVRQLAISIKALATLLWVARPPESADHAGASHAPPRANVLVSLRRKRDVKGPATATKALAEGGGRADVTRAGEHGARGEGSHDHAAE